MTGTTTATTKKRGFNSPGPWPELPATMLCTGRPTAERDGSYDSFGYARYHSPIANHVPSATTATTTAHHTTGVTCFELPLRGESLAAWLNS